MSHIGGLKNLVNNFSRKEVPTMTEQALRKMIAAGESTQQELPFEAKTEGLSLRWILQTASFL